MSALHLEYFERIARSALERIILAPDKPPEPYFVRIEPELAFKAGNATGTSKKPKKNKRQQGRGVGFGLKKGEHYSPGTNARDGLFRLEHGEQAGDSILLAGDRPSDKVGDPFALDRKIGGAQGDGRS